MNIHKKKVRVDSGGIRKASSGPFCLLPLTSSIHYTSQLTPFQGYQSQATITFAKDKRTSMQGTHWQGDHHVCALAQGMPWKLWFFRSILNGLTDAIWTYKGIYPPQRKLLPMGEWAGVSAYVWVGPYMEFSQQQLEYLGFRAII